MENCLFRDVVWIREWMNEEGGGTNEVANDVNGQHE